MSSSLNPFARIKTTFRGRDCDCDSGDGLKMVAPTPTPRSVAPASPSKGPPPLPKMAAPALPPRDILPVEELFFQEGIDGRAESIPGDGAGPFALDGANPLLSAEAEATRAARSTIPPTSLDDEWPEAVEEIEDPARTRRRRAARVGTAWGTVVALAALGVGVFVSPRPDVRSAAAATSPVPVETTVAHPPAATPALATPPPSQGPQPLPAAAIPLPPPVRTPTASAPAPVSASPASCRSGMLPSVAGHATCVDVAESFLCARDPRTRALHPAGCIDAKSPKAACESRGARLATSAERQQLAGAKGKTSAGAFRCAAAR